MNKFFISVLLLTAISISSCTNDDSLAPASSPSPVRANGVQVSVNATIEGSQHIAKTHLAYDGDLEKYLYKFDGNETMAFFCGEESYKAVLSIAPGSENLSSAVFSGAISNISPNYYYGVVPASAASGVDIDGKITITLPSVQEVAAGAMFDPSAHIVTSKSEKNSDLTLKTANSFLLLTIPKNETRTFRSIKIVSLGGENIAGTVLYNPDDDTYTEVDGEMSKSVTIEGKFAHGSSVLISLLPCTLSKGFKLIATDTDEKQYILVSTKEVTFERNTYNMAEPVWKTGLYRLYDLKWNPNDAFRNYTKIVFDTKVPDGIDPDSPLFQTGDGKVSVYESGTELYYISSDEICLCGELSQMFDFFSAEEIVLNNFNTDEVTDMSLMFRGCSALRVLNLGSNFNTENVTDINTMFNYCSALTSLDLGGKFNTSKVTNMSYMFSDCASLASLVLGNNFNTCEVTNMEQMFYGCKALTELDLGDYFNTGNVEDMDYMFYDCIKLETIKTSQDFESTSLFGWEDMFRGCENLQGGNGTKYSFVHVDYEYACIDGGEAKPGYFTQR